MSNVTSRIARNSADLRARVADAAATTRRSADEITLVAVTKYVGEAAKHGFPPDAVGPSLDELAGYEQVEVRGLMCMAGFQGGPDAARRDFAALRDLRDRLRAGCPDRVQLDELSMRMSGDYEVAIQEGATIVRIGSALHEGVF